MSRWVVRAFLMAWLGMAAFSPDARAQSRQFGDIGVSALALANGDTFHGYFEFRFNLLNSDPSRDHTVTVELPMRSTTRGRDSIQRMRRSVKVSAGGSVVLPLFQPALPMEGSHAAIIYVDGREAGNLPLPTGLNHGGSYGGSPPPRPYLVSRSLDSSALDSAFTKVAGGGTSVTVDYSAFQATGGPNVPSGRGGYHGNAWMPASPGRSDWIELRYATKLVPERIRIVSMGRPDSVKRIEFLDDGGGVVGVVTNSGASGRFENRYTPLDLGVSGVTQAVQRVRIDLDGRSGPYLGIDAVELIAGSTNLYAVGASASSTYATRHGSSGKSAVHKPGVLRSELEVVEWSDNWLAYTAFDAIVLHESDLALMPAGVAQAFWQYVEAGGVAAILGKARFPASVRSRLDTSTPEVRRHFVGFGECLELDALDTRDLNVAEVQLMDAAGGQAGSVWSAFGDVSMANSTFPVIENLNIPVRAIALIMLLFIIVVGPLNIYLLARINRRIWMLWTIPIISLTTCGIVFVYSLFSEGITPTVRMESVTLLDHGSHRATTLGRLAYYCPLTPSEGLRFDYDTEVFPLVSRGWSDGTPRTIDWTSGQHLESGWVQARMPAHFAVRKSEARRERLQFEREPGGAWTVMNGLGVTVNSVLLRTAATPAGTGHYLVSANGPIAPGAKAALTPSADQRLGSRPGATLRKVFRDGQWSTASAGKTLASSALAEGSYVAELEGNPFLDLGMEGRRHLRSSAVVVGNLSAAEVAQ